MSAKNFIENALPSFHLKVESLAPQASYTANAAGFTFGAITFNQWVMGITLVLGVLTFIVNFHYQRKRNERERAREAREDELHRIKMQQLLNPPSPPGH